MTVASAPPGAGPETPSEQIRSYKGEILNVGFSPNGEDLLYAEVDGEVRLRAVAARGRSAGGDEENFPLPESYVTLSPDAKTLALLVKGGVQLWDVRAGREKASFPGNPKDMLHLTFAPNGKLLAGNSWEATVSLWDTETGKARVLGRVWDFQGTIHLLAFSPDSRLLAFSTRAGQVGVWEVSTGKQVGARQLRNHQISALAFSPDGKTLALAGVVEDESAPLSGGTLTGVELWDVGLKGHTTLKGGERDQVLGLAFSPDGKLLASAARQTVRLWDVVAGKERACWKADLGNDRGCVAFRPDSTKLAAGGGGNIEGLGKVWEVSTGKELVSLDGHNLRIGAVGFLDEGTVVSVSRDMAIKLWDVRKGQQVAAFPGAPTGLACVNWSADGSMVAWGCDDGSIRVRPWMSGWDATGTLKGHTGAVRWLAFTADGKTLASAGEDGTARVWDVPTGKERLCLRGHDGAVLAVAFAPGDKVLATGGADGSVRLWDAVSGKERGVLTGHEGGVRCVRFSPDGTLLASAGDDRTVRLWDTASGKPVRTLRGHNGTVWSVAFTADGGVLAAGSGDVGPRGVNAPGEIKLWDLKTFQERATLTGHKGLVRCVAFRNDGKLLISGSTDQFACLWDVAKLTKP